MKSEETLSKYSSSCLAVANDYIERSTRFGATDLKVLGASPETHRFQIRLRHSLEVISDAKDYYGTLKPGDDDFYSADWNRYQQEVQKQAQAELGREETLNELIVAVKAQPYASISTRTCVRTHGRRLFHPYACSKCHGSGHVTCYNCGGSGTERCSRCSGSGHTSCTSCGGRGNVQETQQVRDYTGHYHLETRYRPCYSCSGGRVTCHSCRGSGKTTCLTCSGSGKIICGTCVGHGHLTRITATNTYTLPEFHGFYTEGTPDYVHNALCKAGFANLEQYGTIEFEAIDITREHAQADFIFRGAINFCELSLDLAGHQSTWIMYGEPPRIYDTGGTVEAILQEDFKRLDALEPGWSHLHPGFHRRARQVVASFMESEIHQEIIDADHQGFAPAAIVEKVNRSLSAEYIERSLTRLRQILQSAGSWWSLKCSLGVAVASIPFAILGVTLMELTKPHTMLATQEHLRLFPWITGPLTPWVTALLTVPFSVAGWLLTKWISHRWVKRTGGERLVSWAGQKGLLIGKRTAWIAIAATATVAANFFEKWPIWMDKDGKIYGAVAIFQPPKIIAPAPSQSKKPTRSSQRNDKRQSTVSPH